MRVSVCSAAAVSAMAFSSFMPTEASAAIEFAATVANADIGRERSVDGDIARSADVIAGVDADLSVPVSGKPFTAHAADLAADTAITFRIAAPAGQHFLVHEESSFIFAIRFGDIELTDIDPLPAAAVSMVLDGVPVTNDLLYHGLGDSDFIEFAFGAMFIDVAPGTTFREFVITLDYAPLQAALLAQAPGPQTLTDAYVGFYDSERDATENNLGPIVTVVPEPASMALLGLGAALVASRRRA